MSRQVQALEALLEVALFKREGRHIELTAAGALYQHELAGALARIRGATLQTISHRIEADTLHLAVLPTFASKWLMPRMGDFYGRHPGSLVHLHSRIVRGDLSDGVQDMSAIICAGSGQWPAMWRIDCFRRSWWWWPAPRPCPLMSRCPCRRQGGSCSWAWCRGHTRGRTGLPASG